MTDPVTQSTTSTTNTDDVIINLDLEKNETPTQDIPEISLDFSSTPTETENTPVAEEITTPESTESIPEISLDISSTPEETPVPESTENIPEISLDISSTPEESIDTNTTETTPVAEETTTPEISFDTPTVEETPVPESTESIPEISLDISSTPEESTDTNTTENTPVAEETTTTETQTQNSDNRLDQEDKLVEENLQSSQETTENTPITEEQPQANIVDLFVSSEETPTPETTETSPVTEDTSISEETTTPQIEDTQTEEIQQTNETPTVEENTQPQEESTTTQDTSNLQKDQQIISQIQSIAQSGTTSQATQETTQPQASGINLDDILGGPAPVAQTSAPEVTPTLQTNPITNQPLPPQTILPAFTQANNYTTLPTANIQQTQQPIANPAKNKKLFINLAIGIGAFVIFGFIFKTMYPIQYQQLIGKSTTPIITDTNTPPTDTETSDTSESGDTIQTDTTNDGLFANASTDQTHGSALEETTDFNAFEDLNEVIDTGFDEEATKTKLQEYISQGKKLRVIAQKSNDTESKKYSLFLWKKATTLLDEIENGTEINTDDINQQMAQFSEYLNKLTSNEETPVPETKPEPTPTPEEFFGTNGTETTDQQKPQDITTETISGEQESAFAEQPEQFN